MSQGRGGRNNFGGGGEGEKQPQSGKLRLGYEGFVSEANREERKA